MRTGLAVIHGTGLIGSSIGLGLTTAGWEVAGWDPSAAASRAAMEKGAISSVLGDPFQHVDDADLLVLAGPPSATLAALQDLSTGTLVTDVASVKSPVVAAGGRLERFVPGHPMAGSATSGAHNASGHMFHGATWVLCNDLATPEDLETAAGVVASLGANPVVMSAAAHDLRVALVSHLPRLLASTLIEMADEVEGAHELSAGSFKDLTRVAGSDADWWTDVLVSNQYAVGEAIDRIGTALSEWKRQISSDPSAVEERLERARRGRAALGPDVAAVRVILFDKPGEIGLVGRALEESAVDLRDLQLRHAEYGGGGVLTLAVASNEAPALRNALTRLGFEVED